MYSSTGGIIDEWTKRVKDKPSGRALPLYEGKRIAIREEKRQAHFVSGTDAVVGPLSLSTNTFGNRFRGNPVPSDERNRSSRDWVCGSGGTINPVDNPVVNHKQGIWPPVGIQAIRPYTMNVLTPKKITILPVFHQKYKKA